MASARIDIRLEGANRLKRAMRLLSEAEAPFLKAALEESGELLAGEAEGRGPGRIGRSVSFVGVRGTGGALRSLSRATHPGARSMEFGRTTYYRGFTGRNQKSGTKFKAARGQKARPFAGIKNGNAALGAVKPRVEALLSEAIAAEWERVARGPDTDGG